MISGYSYTDVFGGKLLRSRMATRSRVYKHSVPGFPSVDGWVSQHPLLGSRVFDTWREAMDHANSRRVDFLWQTSG